MFLSDIAEKVKGLRLEFMHLGSVCQTLCGFASLRVVFVPIMSEGEDVPGSCSERGLELEHVVVVEWCLSIAAAFLQVTPSRALCHREGDHEWRTVMPDGNGDAG